MASTFWASPISRAAMGTSNAPGTVISTTLSPSNPASVRPATTCSCSASTISPPQRVRMTPTRRPLSVSDVGKPGMRAVMGARKEAGGGGGAAAAVRAGVKADTPSGDRQVAAAAAKTRPPMGAAPAARKAVVDGAIAKKGWQTRQESGDGARCWRRHGSRSVVGRARRDDSVRARRMAGAGR